MKKKQKKKRKTFIGTMKPKIGLAVCTAAFCFLLLSNSDSGSRTDDRAPSTHPPGDLPAEQVPQFVVIGFDDNCYSGLENSGGSGGMAWALDLFASRKNPPGLGNIFTFDGTSARASFYVCTQNIETWYSESPKYVKYSWRFAFEQGHEIGLHSHTHSHGGSFSVAQWEREIETCLSWLTRPYDPEEPPGEPDATKGIGIPPRALIGWRSPYLEPNDHLYTAMLNQRLAYDCSLEEGWQVDQDGTNFFWPYTLNNGSPGNRTIVDWDSSDDYLGSHPGIWELPVYTVIVPPDDKCAEYGLAPGLRSKMKALSPWFDEQVGKISGFDYNLWVKFKMTRQEFVATLKYTLDMRLTGNRAPFLFGAHTDYYSSKSTEKWEASCGERQEAMEEFIDYALSKPDVRIVSGRRLLDWLRTPLPL